MGRSRLFPGCAAEVATSSAAQLSSLRGLPAPPCPEVQPGRVRLSRSPSPAPLPGGGEPRGAQAPPAARRTRGRRGTPAQPPALSPGPGAHSPRGEEALPRPDDQLREGHGHRGAEHRVAPSGNAAVAAIAAGPASATAGCRAPTGFAPCPCLETASDSECQAAPFPFLPSFLASRPFPAVSLPPPAPSGARCQAAPCGCRGRGCPPCGPRVNRERPPLPLGECREPCARRRAAPGWLSSGCSACVSVSCLCLGGRRRGPRRGQPALTPPSDRRRAPNQRRQPRSARPRSGAPRAATPGQRGVGPGALRASSARGREGRARPTSRARRQPRGPERCPARVSAGRARDGPAPASGASSGGRPNSERRYRVRNE